jgi:hypothetical protein
MGAYALYIWSSWETVMEGVQYDVHAAKTLFRLIIHEEIYNVR